MSIHPMTVHPRPTSDEYSWTVEWDDGAESYFIVGPHGTVAMVHRAEDRDMLASAPALFYENQRLKAELAAMKGGAA